MRMNNKFRKLLFAMAAIASTCFAYAEDEWIGRWASEPIHVDTETLTLIYEFKDSTNMVMAFETDNMIPNVGECVSYISATGTYEKIGPIFVTSIDQSTLKAEIKKLVIDKAPESLVEQVKSTMTKKILNEAKSTFSGFDVGTMIYVNTDNPNELLFILGDETNAMELRFNRMN